MSTGLLQYLLEADKYSSLSVLRAEYFKKLQGRTVLKHLLFLKYLLLNEHIMKDFKSYYKPHLPGEEDEIRYK